MCEFITPALAAIGLGGGATAAGATAAATTAGTLQTIGAMTAIAGSRYCGVSAYRTGRANAVLIDRQRRTEAQMNAIEDQRQRARFASAMRQQTAELAGRGISLDSPTAVTLGQYAGQEMAFNSQAVRSGGQARDAELSLSARNSRAQATLGLLRGGVSAAGTLLTAAPDVWPELLA